MSTCHSLVAQAVAKHGTAYVARRLEVSRSALLSFVAGTGREAQRLLIEQRAGRLTEVEGAER